MPRALLLLLALAACASPESRVEDALLRAGLSPSVSQCMARRLTDRLSIAQLRKLSAAMEGGAGAPLTMAEIERRVDRIGDPQIVSVAASAGIGCFLAG